MDITTSLNKAIDTLQLDVIRDQITALKDEGSEPERLKSALERILRMKAVNFGNSNASVTEINAFVELLISLTKQEICAKTLTIQIIQDIFDTSSTNRCEELFGIVETHIDTWKTPYFESCKNMILRMCNDLLKRLSRTIDTTFCGRILILLAKSLPLNEKSGLNLPGQFNMQNVTIYDQEKKELFDDAQPIQADDDMEMGEIRENKDASGTIPVDYNLYIKFWDLQKLFTNPNLLFEPEQFKQFEKDISDVFSIFSAYKLEKPQRQNDNSPSRTREATETETNSQNRRNKVKVTAKREIADATNGEIDHKNDAEANGFLANTMEIDVDAMEVDASTANLATKNSILSSDQTFFAKYLTSQKLFPLQLADSQFRRYFLIQFLVVSNYLSSKAKLKDMIDITPAQEIVLRELTDKCYLLLKETYPHGSHFSDSIKKILSREKQWSIWKGEGCPDIVGLVNNAKDRKCATFKRKPISRYDGKILDLGNRELTRLWNIEKNNLQACRSVNRKCIPSLKPFLEEAIDEMDPEQQVEEQYQSMSNEKYQWMANRFLLFNSDQYINLAVQEANTRSQDKPERSNIPNMNAIVLRKAIQIAAEGIPDLKPRLDQIQERIEKKAKKEIAARQAEEARLAEKTKELEKRIKQEEEEQQAILKSVKKEEMINGNAAIINNASTSNAEANKKEEKMVVNHNNSDHHQQQHQNSTSAGKKERTSERQRPAPQPDPNEKEEVPKKRIKHDTPEMKRSPSTGSRTSSRRKEKGGVEQPTPEHDQHQHRSGSKKVEEKEKERKGTTGGGGGADDAATDRKDRKRIVEKSEERKEAGRTATAVSTNSITVKVGSEKDGRKGGTSVNGGGRSSSDRDHRGSDGDRVKKRK